jgi:hypothetical protein
MSAVTHPRWLDPTDIGVALAMRNASLLEGDVACVLGYMANLYAVPE